MELTQELVVGLFDYREGCLFWKVRRQGIVKINMEAGCIITNKDGSRCYIKINGKPFLRSRLIFIYHIGYLPIIVDHINHNTLDDRIENLRAASMSQNSKNKTSHKGSSSMFLGVSLRGGRFHATIYSNKINKYLGSFKTEELAAIAYDNAAKEIHGEFANLNFK